MKNILLKRHLPASSQEDNPPSLQDNWARKQISLHTHELDQHGAEIRDIRAIVNDLREQAKSDLLERFDLRKNIVQIQKYLEEIYQA